MIQLINLKIFAASVTNNFLGGTVVFTSVKNSLTQLRLLILKFKINMVHVLKMVINEILKS
jgi:hypothetical protein